MSEWHENEHLHGLPIFMKLKYQNTTHSTILLCFSRLSPCLIPKPKKERRKQKRKNIFVNCVYVYNLHIRYSLLIYLLYILREFRKLVMAS